MNCPTLTKLEAKLQLEHSQIKFWSSPVSKGTASDATLRRLTADARERIPAIVDKIHFHKRSCEVCKQNEAHT